MNYYLTGIEGMPKLLESCEGSFAHFKRNLYPDYFQKLYQKNFQTFDAIENGYNSVIDKEQFLKNMAGALVEYAVGKMGECRRRSDRERRLMDYNMAMVTYVFPMILEFQGNSSVPLTEKLIEAWKEAFPKSTLQATSFETIESGFHRKFCYITTAVCGTLGKPDDCYELTLLRDYRDHYLSALPDGKAMIREYYDVAPSVVKHIDQREDAAEIYRSIWESYLAPCIRMIEEGQNEACLERYMEMVRTLRGRYMCRGGY